MSKLTSTSRAASLKHISFDFRGVRVPNLVGSPVDNSVIRHAMTAYGFLLTAESHPDGRCTLAEFAEAIKASYSTDNLQNRVVVETLTRIHDEEADAQEIANKMLSQGAFLPNFSDAKAAVLASLDVTRLLSDAIIDRAAYHLSTQSTSHPMPAEVDSEEQADTNQERPR